MNFGMDLYMPRTIDAFSYLERRVNFATSTKASRPGLNDKHETRKARVLNYNPDIKCTVKGNKFPSNSYPINRRKLYFP